MIAISDFLLALATVVGLVALVFSLRASARAFLTYRGRAVVTCPETQQLAGVRLDAKHAAFTGVVGQTVLRLQNCSRWPAEKRQCGQEWLDQIEAAPEHCLVRTLVATWFQGKACVSCRQPFGKIHWHDHKPALLGSEGRTLEWSEIPAEGIPQALTTHRPVYWNCHIAETFRREHPELVVDRPWRATSERLASTEQRRGGGA